MKYPELTVHKEIERESEIKTNITISEANSQMTPACGVQNVI